MYKFKELKNYIKENFLYKLTIKTRLLIYFFIIVFIPTCVITLTIYNISKNIITSKIEFSIQKNLEMIDLNILKKFDEANDQATNLYLNPEFIDITFGINFKNDFNDISIGKDYTLSKFDIINELDKLNKILDNLESSSVSSSLIVPSLYVFQRPEYSNFSYSKKVFPISQIQSQDWYLKLPPNDNYTVVGLDTINVNETNVKTILLDKRIYSLNYQSLPYFGLLTLNIGVDDFIKILNNYGLSQSDSITVIDKDNNIVLSNNNTFSNTTLLKDDYIKQLSLTNKSFIAKINNSDVLVSHKKISSLNWTILYLSPLNSLYSQLVSFKKVIYISFIICIILGLFISWILSNNISKPITHIINSMKTVKDGEFDIQLEYKRKDEFAYLVEQYNKMLLRIKNLIDKLYISEVKEKQSQLTALQAQINPHFLYNTLDSINWIALSHDVPDISLMVTSLSNFFRYSLSKGKNIISLRDEIKQVESYLIIQKIRFDEKLDYNINFSNELLNYTTLKLIIQPLVENAIIHGIEKRRGKGFISISSERHDNYLLINVSDNGIGANIDYLNSLLDDPDGDSFGIKNVNERIKNHFGKEFGLSFSANSTVGIIAIIKIPLTNEM